MLNSVTLLLKSVPIRTYFRWTTFIACLMIVVWMVNYLACNHKIIAHVNSTNIYLWIAIILIPFNLSIESLKLHYRLKTHLTFWQVCIQIGKGYAYNLITPLGIGTYAGRLWNIPTAFYLEISKLTLASSICQTACNVIFGMLLGTYFWIEYLGISPTGITFILMISAGCILISFLILNFTEQSGNPQILKIRRRVSEMLNSTWHTIRLKDWTILSILSILRYSIYLVQCILVIQFLDIYDFINTLQAVAVYLLLMSLVHLPSLFSVFSRMVVSIWVFSAIGLTYEQSASFSVIIFMLNTLIPAMFGLMYLFKDTIQLKS